MIAAFFALFVAQSAPVDPLRVFYMADFHDPLLSSELPIPRGRVSARALEPPYAALKTAEVTYINGALALDPVRGVLYGNRCCRMAAAIQALDARTLEVLEDKSIVLETSGSISMELDPLRRLLFVLDGHRLTLHIVSIDSVTYGEVLISIQPPQLFDDEGNGSGDIIALDLRTGRAFFSGHDGGDIMRLDYSELDPKRPALPEPVRTGQIARTSGDSGASLAIDEDGRRLFFIPADGIVRAFSADPPHVSLGDLFVEEMSFSDCGLFYDGRNETLYVGREVYGNVPMRPIAIDLSGGFPGTSAEIEPTPYDGDDLAIYGASFSGPTGLFAEPLPDVTLADEKIEARAESFSCSCAAAKKRATTALFLTALMIGTCSFRCAGATRRPGRDRR